MIRTWVGVCFVNYPRHGGEARRGGEVGREAWRDSEEGVGWSGSTLGSVVWGEMPGWGAGGEVRGEARDGFQGLLREEKVSGMGVVGGKEVYLKCTH